MSAVPDNERIIGDVITIEHCEDVTATTPSWNVIAATTDSIESSPNTEVGDSREHGSFQLQKDSVSEAWELSFMANMLTGPAQLQTVGLLTDNFEEKGQVDPGRDAPEALRVTIYATQADYDAGDFKYQSGTDNYVLIHDGGEIQAEDYSQISFVIHSRRRPIRLGLGGTFDGAGGA